MVTVCLIVLTIMVVTAIVKGMVKEAIKVGVSFVLLTGITAWSRNYYSTKGTFITDFDNTRIIEVPNITMCVVALIITAIGVICVGNFLKGNKVMSMITGIITALMYFATLSSGTEIYVPALKPLGLILGVCVFIVCTAIRKISVRS